MEYSNKQHLYPFKFSNLILLVSFGILLLSMWPGTMTNDSEAQYHAAIHSMYSDHHPPLMSFIWHYLDKIIKGPGLMLVMHLTLLFSALYFFVKTTKIKWPIYIYPFIPVITIYAHMIWKDVAFAYSFLCVGGYLSYINIAKKKLRPLPFLFIFLILLYGTAVKFQAQYCAPVMLLWITLSFGKTHRTLKKSIITFTVLTVSFYVMQYYSARALVPAVQQNHSWQYVKLYDLTGMSLQLNEVLFPTKFLSKDFSLEKLKSNFSGYSVDDIAFPKESLVKVGRNEEERQELRHYWLKTIMHHPIAYIKHRSHNMQYMLLGVPGLIKFTQVLNNRFSSNTLFYKITFNLGNFLGYIFMAPISYLILCLFYITLGIKMRNNTTSALPLLFLNLVGLIMFLSLFFFSMAGTPRYLYIMVCMVNVSHVFAYANFKKLITNTQYNKKKYHP